jgi:hypothetical protein
LVTARPRWGNIIKSHYKLPLTGIMNSMKSISAPCFDLHLNLQGFESEVKRIRALLMNVTAGYAF